METALSALVAPGPPGHWTASRLRLKPASPASSARATFVTVPSSALPAPLAKAAWRSPSSTNTWHSLIRIHKAAHSRFLQVGQTSHSDVTRPTASAADCKTALVVSKRRSCVQAVIVDVGEQKLLLKRVSVLPPTLCLCRTRLNR